MNRDVEVVLRFTAGRIGHLDVEVAETVAETRATAARLDRLEQRVRRLEGPVAPDCWSTSPIENPPRPEVEPVAPTWDQLVRRAEAELGEGDAGGIGVDDLLPGDTVETIERLHGDLELRTRLDRFDVVAAVTAAAVGTFVDFVVVKIPTGGRWNGRWQSGSRLTFFLRRRAVPSENWLAKLAPVPFDRLSVPVGGLGPRSHRVQTFGHDPLLGLVLGTVDILRGTLSGVHAGGEPVILDAAPPTPGILAALGAEVLHLVSDIGTSMGLPLPGWTALASIPFGQVGPDDETIGGIARWMYLRGYGSWHFLTMATVPAVVETVLRSYVGMRRLVDEDYRRRWEAEVTDIDTVDGHPRYRVLSLMAHGITALGNAGRIGLSGFNPLTVNYAEWLVVIERLVTALRPPSAVDRHTARIRFNRLTLDAGWVTLGIDPDVFRQPPT